MKIVEGSENFREADIVCFTEMKRGPYERGSGRNVTELEVVSLYYRV